MTRRLALGASIVATVAALLLVPALPAVAASNPTKIVFDTPSETVGYGSNWNLSITVSAAYTEFDSSSGTVNVLIKGVPGVYASGIPVNDGGVAFLSPPSAKPPLGAGTYTLTAVFQPSGGTGLGDSQTKSPATLTVSPIGLQATATVVQTVRNNAPSADVVAKLTPAKGATNPAGTWDVVAVDAAGGASLTASATVAAGTVDPTTIELPSVKPAHDYTVTTTFVPDPSISNGYAVTNAVPAKLDLPDTSIVQVLTNPTPEPIGVLAAIGIVLFALLIGAIVLLTGRKPKKAVAEAEPAAEPAAAEPSADA